MCIGIRPRTLSPFLFSAFLIFAWLLPAPANGAGVYQRIEVTVLSSPTHVNVDRRKVPIEELTEAFRARIRGEDRVMAIIYVPLPVSPDLLKEVMAKCRKGGAKAFTVAYKS